MKDRDFPSFNCTVSGPGYGFVYVMAYPGSDKVKIGHTLDPNTRASTIGGTLAPEDPVLQVYYWCSFDRLQSEKLPEELLFAAIRSDHITKTISFGHSPRRGF